MRHLARKRAIPSMKRILMMTSNLRNFIIDAMQCCGVEREAAELNLFSETKVATGNVSFLSSKKVQQRFTCIQKMPQHCV